jgi:hypothetical protein
VPQRLGDRLLRHPGRAGELDFQQSRRPSWPRGRSPGTEVPFCAASVCVLCFGAARLG